MWQEEICGDRLPESPPYFPKDQLTDATERFVVSELIREQVFRYLDKELPELARSNFKKYLELSPKPPVDKVEIESLLKQ